MAEAERTEELVEESVPLPVKTECPERPSSPDTNCAICLEQVQNRSFTDTCFHEFCFNCLHEWSKVKPECPLCKQRFSMIIPNVTYGTAIEPYHVSTPIAPRQGYQRSSAESTFLINLAFQQPPAFRYRTTMGSRTIMYIENISDRLWDNPTRRGIYIPDWRRRRQIGTSEFRRHIYRQGLWVRRCSDLRVRESSPEFYRLNPAQTHRLVPWLNRELNVLLDVSLDSHAVCHEILNLITIYAITSPHFARAIDRYLGARTEHFLHEFYNFATSPYDMLAYDLHANYTSFTASSDDLTRPPSPSGSDSDIEVVHSRVVPEPLVGIDLSTMAGPSGVNSARDTLLVEISDDSDGSVEFIAALPPRNQRTPEIITLMDSEDEDDGTQGVGSIVEVVDEPLEGPSVAFEERLSEAESVIEPPEPRVRKKRRAAANAEALVKYELTSSAEESHEKRRKHKSKKKKKKKSSRKSESPSRPSVQVIKYKRCKRERRDSSSTTEEKKRPRLRSVVKLVNSGSSDPSEPHTSRWPTRIRHTIYPLQPSFSSDTDSDSPAEPARHYNFYQGYKDFSSDDD